MGRYRAKKLENMKKGDLVKFFGKIEHIDNYEYKSKKGEVYKILVNVIEKNDLGEIVLNDTIESIAFLNYKDRKYKVAKELFDSLVVGDGVVLEGTVGIDETYHKIIIPSVHIFTQIPTRQVVIDNIEKFKFEERKEESEYNRVEFQVTTKFSTQQSIVDVKDLVEINKQFGNNVVSVADRGVCQGFPDFEYEVKKNDMKGLYGVEFKVSDETLTPYITNSKKKYDDNTYFFFDIETTSLNATFGEIIEIGVVKIKNGKKIDEFQKLIKPKKSISATTTELTGITNEMVRDAENELTVLKQFKKFVGTSTLVAHNAKFDYNYIQQKCKKYSTDFNFDNNPIVDTLKMSRLLFKKLNKLKKRKFTLDIMLQEYDIDFEGNHHRAKDDALMCYRLYEKLLVNHKKGKKVINGFEYYGLKNLQMIHDKGEEFIDSWNASRMLVYAKNQAGRKSLYQLVSLVNITYTDEKTLPLDEVLQRRKNLILISGGFEAKDLFDNLLDGKIKKKDLVKYDAIGIQPTSQLNKKNNKYKTLSNKKIQKINTFLIKNADENNVPVIAIGGVHYINKFEEKYLKPIVNESIRSGLPHLDKRIKKDAFFKTTKEMLEDFSYLGKNKSKEIVVDNTIMLAEEFEEIFIVEDKLYTPFIKEANEVIRKKVNMNLEKKYGKNPDKEILERFKDEEKKIINKGYGVIFYASSSLIERSEKNGYIVEDRGSVGSSFYAFLSDISELNPLPTHYLCQNSNCCNLEWMKEIEDGYDLDDKKCEKCIGTMKGEGGYSPYSVFGGKGKVPDIDMNFADVYQHEAHQHIFDMFGKEKSFRAGTVSTYSEGKSKKIVWDLFKKESKKEDFLLEELYSNDYNFFYKDKMTGEKKKQKNIYGSLDHIIVEELKEKGGVKKVFRETFKIKDGYFKEYHSFINNVKYGTGIHAGGVIVLPNGYEIEDFTPQTYAKDGKDKSVITTHLDFNSIHDTVLKIDALGHSSPTIFFNLEKETGINVKKINFTDKKVLEELGKGITAGIPEFNTIFSTNVILQTKPRIFSDYIRLMGLTHGTGIWLGNGEELVEKGKSIRDIFSTREDVLKLLLSKGIENKMATDIFEFVRKGKLHDGKMENIKKWEEWKVLMFKKGIEKWEIESMEKIKYLFPRQHGKSYAKTSLRMAYYRYHHLKEFTKVLLDKGNETNDDVNTKKKSKKSISYLPILLEKKEFDNMISDIEKRWSDPKTNPTNKEKTSYPTYKLIQHFMNKGYKIYPVDLEKSADKKFIYEEDGLRLPLSVMPNINAKLREKIIKTRKKDVFTSKKDLNRLTGNKNYINTIAMYCGLK
ncbi:exonuclease domain-containing protein [Virgibacillus sp. DJP39]|uniref:exonuclease domain-containing protein n=1 Tax=Virgibacillus sp. DJP39 TaxID=3409790 RepID=UPI003BB7E4FB